MQQNYFSLVQSISFSSVTANVLEKQLCVKSGGVLLLKSGIDARKEKTSLLGQNHIWSSENFVKHIIWLETLVPRKVHRKPTVQHLPKLSSSTVRGEPPSVDRCLPLPRISYGGSWSAYGVERGTPNSRNYTSLQDDHLGRTNRLFCRRGRGGAGE